MTLSAKYRVVPILSSILDHPSRLYYIEIISRQSITTSLMSAILKFMRMEHINVYYAINEVSSLLIAAYRVADVIRVLRCEKREAKLPSFLVVAGGWPSW